MTGMADFRWKARPARDRGGGPRRKGRRHGACRRRRDVAVHYLSSAARAEETVGAIRALGRRRSRSAQTSPNPKNAAARSGKPRGRRLDRPARPLGRELPSGLARGDRRGALGFGDERQRASGFPARPGGRAHARGTPGPHRPDLRLPRPQSREELPRPLGLEGRRRGARARARRRAGPGGLGQWSLARHRARPEGTSPEEPRSSPAAFHSSATAIPRMSPGPSSSSAPALPSSPARSSPWTAASR